MVTLDKVGVEVGRSSRRQTVAAPPKRNTIADKN